MPDKADGRGAPVGAVLSVPEKSVGTIVQEVDRFLRSVRANIEDWKFSMEDAGDGTRIFVRFQIRIDSAAATPPPADLEGKAARPEGAGAMPDTSSGSLREHESSSRAKPRSRAGADERSDPDLALFVEEWKRKRERRVGGEFHQPGAPLGDAPAARTPRRRHRRRATRS